MKGSILTPELIGAIFCAIIIGIVVSYQQCQPSYVVHREEKSLTDTTLTVAKTRVISPTEAEIYFSNGDSDIIETQDLKVPNTQVKVSRRRVIEFQKNSEIKMYTKYWVIRDTKPF